MLQESVDKWILDDDQTSLEKIILEAKKDDPYALLVLACSYWVGKGELKRDRHEEVDLFERAEKIGSPKAKRLLTLIDTRFKFERFRAEWLRKVRQSIRFNDQKWLYDNYNHRNEHFMRDNSCIEYKTLLTSEERTVCEQMISEYKSSSMTTVDKIFDKFGLKTVLRH